MGDPVVLTAALGFAGTLAGLVAGLRRGRADATKLEAEATRLGAEASTISSADNREWAAMFIGRLSATEAKLDATEAELDTCREARLDAERRFAAAEREIAGLKRDVAELKKLLRQHGITPPGETPAGGTKLEHTKGDQP